MPHFYISVLVFFLFVSSSSSSRTVLRIQTTEGLSSASELESQQPAELGQQYSTQEITQETLAARRHTKDRRLLENLADLHSHSHSHKMKMNPHHPQKPPPAPSPKSTTATSNANSHSHTDYVCANSC